MHEHELRRGRGCTNSAMPVTGGTGSGMISTFEEALKEV